MLREAARRLRRSRRGRPPAGDDRLFLPDGYRSRTTATFLDTLSEHREPITHQPDVYPFAAHLARRFGATRILDLGCGAATKLLPLAEEVEIAGIDHPATIERLQARHPGHRWLPVDLEHADERVPVDLAADAVVVCSDVIEHLVDPRPLLALLRRCQERAHAIVLSTPDRALVRGPDDRGPPANEFHVREWQLDELHALLRAEGLAPTFIGLTSNNDRDLQKRTILAVIDRSLGVISEPPPEFRVHAMMGSYNERDIVVAAVRHLRRQDVEVTVLDDWSTDGSWELLQDRFAGDPGVSCIRNREQPGTTFDWKKHLARKAEVGLASGADWLIHQDADELRESPWPGVSLRQSCWHAQTLGFNAIDHTVLDFRPVVEGFSEHQDPDLFFRHFEWGRRPGHFLQVKVWRNEGQSPGYDLTAGHSVDFPGLRISPYKHLLRHYSLRSQEQAIRKVVHERLPRYPQAARAGGLHRQYDGFDADDPWAWSADDLEAWDPPTFRRELLVERLSGVGIVRA